MKVLDIFCGLGGWSEGFDRMGFDCTGVDIVDVGYPFRLIKIDVNELDPKTLGYFDVVVGSPPCREFSQTTYLSKVRNWKEQPNSERGLKLVYAFLKLVEQMKPRFWIMENVKGLCRYLPLPPCCTIKMTPTMRRCLWGDFPAFLVPIELRQIERKIKGGKLRPWLRAKIPLPVSLAAAEAIKQKLILKEKVNNRNEDSKSFCDA